MSTWGFLRLLGLIAVVSVGFALAITLLVYFVAWIFNQGRKSARRR